MKPKILTDKQLDAIWADMELKRSNLGRAIADRDLSSARFAIDVLAIHMQRFCAHEEARTRKAILNAGKNIPSIQAHKAVRVQPLKGKELDNQTAGWIDVIRKAGREQR